MGDDQLDDLELDGLITKGGIEDTTFEAKAKDSEKLRGQGPTFRGQTDPLEAKDRNGLGQGPRTQFF